MSFRIIDINPNNSPKEILYKYIDFFDKLQLEHSPKDPLTQKDIQLKRMKVERAGEVRIRKAVLFEETDEIIARLHILYFTEESHEFKKNKHIIYLDINILKEFKESDAAKELLLSALEVIKQNKLFTTLEVCSVYQRDWKFWENLGLKLTIEEGVNRLYLNEANWDLMKEWVKEGRRRAQDESVELLAFKECPDRIIEDYTALYTDLMKLVPFGDSAWSPSIITPKTLRENEVNHKKRGFDWWILVSKEKDGNLSGLTEIFFSPDTHYRVNQELTGVQLEYRGRGLGKWLKAEMLFYIKENLPKTVFIQTGNADFNAPMMFINEKMGFKRHLSEKCFKIQLDELEKNLKYSPTFVKSQ